MLFEGLVLASLLDNPRTCLPQKTSAITLRFQVPILLLFPFVFPSLSLSLFFALSFPLHIISSTYNKAKLRYPAVQRGCSLIQR